MVLWLNNFSASTDISITTAAPEQLPGCKLFCKSIASKINNNNCSSVYCNFGSLSILFFYAKMGNFIAFLIVGSLYSQDDFQSMLGWSKNLKYV